VMREWTLDLPYTAPPLSLNGARGNHYAHARQVKQVRRQAAFLAQQAKIPPLARCTIELHYAPRDRRDRDPHNLVATLKPIEDGIVDAGVVPKDTPEFVPPTTPVIDPPTGGPGRLYVVVRELEPHAEASR
jgi:crossover junction endodeoxyribonuclease RusA